MAEKKVSVILDLTTKGVKGVHKAVGALTKLSTLPFTTIGRGIKGVFSTLTSFKGVIGAVVSAKIGTAILSTVSKFEQWKVAFKTLTGSAQRGLELMNELKDIAKKTPFELPGLVEQTKRLLAMGIETDKIGKTIKALGDITAGVGKEKMPQLILAFGQVKTKGKLMGQELRQFNEAGVDLLDALSENMGKSKQEISNMVTAGEIGFEDVEKALYKVTSEGGRFYNLMEEQSKTLGGIFSNIKDDITLVVVAFGEKALPTFKWFATLIRNFTKSDDFTKWAERLGESVNKILVHWKTIATGALWMKKMIRLYFNEVETNLKVFGLSAQEIIKRPFYWQTYKKIFTEFIDKVVNFVSATVKLSKTVVTQGMKAVKTYRESLLEDEKSSNSTFETELTKIKQQGIDDRKQIEQDYVNDIKNIKLPDLQEAYELHDSHVQAFRKKSTDDALNNDPDSIKKTNEAFYAWLAQKGIDHTTLTNDELGKQLTAYTTHINNLRTLGADFVTDTEGTLNKIVNDVILGENGFAKTIQDGLAGFLGTDVAAFVSGGVGQIIALGIGNIISAILGSDPVKTVAELAAEKFEEMVKRTNKALEDLGREKGLVEQQIEIVEELYRRGQRTIEDEKIARALGVQVGESITKILSDLFQEAASIESKELKIFTDEYDKIMREITADLAIITNPQAGRAGNLVSEAQRRLDVNEAALEKFKKEHLTTEIFEEILDKFRLESREKSIKESGSSLGLSLQGMSSGGIIPGNFQTGDKLLKRVNSGEMYINNQQQRRLFEMANGGGLGSNDALEKLDEISRALSRPATIELKAAGMDTFVKANYRRQQRMVKTGQLSQRS